MILPCNDCKFRKEEKSGFRIFVSCKYKKKYKDLIQYAEYCYECKHYEKECKK